MLNMICSSRVLLRVDIILISISGAHTNVGMKYNRIHLPQTPLLSRFRDTLSSSLFALKHLVIKDSLGKFKNLLQTKFIAYGNILHYLLFKYCKFVHSVTSEIYLNNLFLWSELAFDLFCDSWCGSVMVMRAFTWRKAPRKALLKSCVTAKHKRCFHDHDFLCSNSYVASDPWKFSLFFVCKGNFAREMQAILKYIKQPWRNFRSPNILLFSFIYIPFACLLFFFFKFFAFLCWNKIIWETT